MTEGQHQREQRPLRAAADSQERPVVPTGTLRRTGRLAMLPLRHAARTAGAASRLSRAAALTRWPLAPLSRCSPPWAS